MGQCPSVPGHTHQRKPPPPPSSPTAGQGALSPPRFSDAASAAAEDAAAGEPDYTADLPEELLAVVFGLLGSGDRKRCSHVCRRWLAAEAASRVRLALDTRAPLLAVVPGILDRFAAVSKLALKCDRRAESVGDPALVVVGHRLGPGLRRLKLRSLRVVTDVGVAAVNLRKLSARSGGGERLQPDCGAIRSWGLGRAVTSTAMDCVRLRRRAFSA